MQMCIQTHPPRPQGELNATLEIVFSTQVYLAMSVDSVWWEYFCHLHKVKLLPKIDPRVFQEEILWEAGRGKTFIPVFYLSFCTRQANCLLTSGRCFKASPTEKVLFVGPGCLLQMQKHLVNPGLAGLGGDCVCATSCQTLSCSLFLPSHTRTCRHKQTSSGWDMRQHLLSV